MTSSNTKLIDFNSDPYKVSDTPDFDKIPNFLEEQYIFVNPKGESYGFFTTTNIKRDASKIKYPYSDGKYKLETLEDENGEFFIIHPNEDYFERNPNT